MYVGGYIKFVDNDERVDIAISARKLIELLSTLQPDQLLRVNPITRNLILESGSYIDLGDETIQLYS